MADLYCPIPVPWSFFFLLFRSLTSDQAEYTCKKFRRRSEFILYAVGHTGTLLHTQENFIFLEIEQTFFCEYFDF